MILMAENSMSAKEYLANKRKEIEENEIKNKARVSKLKRVTGMFACAIVVLTALSYGASKLFIEHKYNSYITGSSNGSVDIELIEYKDAYQKFQNELLGNKGNNIMNYGLVCQGNDFVAYENVKDNKNTLVLLKNNVENIISNSDVEYINTDNKFLYYVKKSDRGIYKNDMQGNEQQLVSDMSAGEMLLYNGNLYFVNNTDNQSIYKVSIEGQVSPEKVVDNRVVKFVISGSSIIYIDDNNKINKFDMDSKLIASIQDKMEDFCYNGSILALNNRKIISFSSSGKNAKILTEGNITLLNSDNDYIYYSKDGGLYQFEIASETETKLIEGYDVYKAVYKIDSKLFCYVLNKNSNNIYIESLVIKNM